MNGNTSELTYPNHANQISLTSYHRRLPCRQVQRVGYSTSEDDGELLNMACLARVQLSTMPSGFCVFGYKQPVPASMRRLLRSRLLRHPTLHWMGSGGMPQSNTLVGFVRHGRCHCPLHFRFLWGSLPYNESACVCAACCKAGT